MAPDSHLAFRLWRACPSPPAPWFHPSGLDCFVADYMMKARAASGSRDMAQHGTLDTQSPTDLSTLACFLHGHRLIPSAHISCEQGLLTALGAHGTLPPHQLHAFRDPTLPYTIFSQAPSPLGAPPISALCAVDSRFPQSYDFSWADLQACSGQQLAQHCHHEHRPSQRRPAALLPD